MQFLMDHAHAKIHYISGAADMDFLAVEQNLSFIHGVHAKNAFHQCGFSGTVFPHQRMDGPWPNLQRDIV